MTTNEAGRKQRLLALEDRIRKAVEAEYSTYLQLKEIRDDELFKDDGYATWKAFCRKHLGMSADQVGKETLLAELHQAHPDFSRRMLLELARLASKPKGGAR